MLHLMLLNYCLLHFFLNFMCVTILVFNVCVASLFKYKPSCVGLLVMNFDHVTLMIRTLWYKTDMNFSKGW